MSSSSASISFRFEWRICLLSEWRNLRRGREYPIGRLPKFSAVVPLGSVPRSVTDLRGSALTEACYHAGCTHAQADALLLLLRGYSIREIADELGLSYPQARGALDNGRERLEQAYAVTLRRALTWYRVVLSCLRNHRAGGTAPVLNYAPSYGGGFDATPATVRARPYGAVAEDLLGDHRAFLRVLLDELCP